MAGPATGEQQLEDGRAEASANSAKSVTRSRRPLIAGVTIIALALGWFFIVRPFLQQSKAKHDVDVLAVALDGYAREKGGYPQGTTGTICALLRGESVDGQNPHRLDYVEAASYEINASGEFVDPWGTSYRISSNPGARVYSCGPNRIDEQGKADDITSWR